MVRIRHGRCGRSRVDSGLDAVRRGVRGAVLEGEDAAVEPAVQDGEGIERGAVGGTAAGEYGAFVSEAGGDAQRTEIQEEDTGNTRFGGATFWGGVDHAVHAKEATGAEPDAGRAGSH